MSKVMNMTAIAEAFEKAGLKPRDVAFDRAIAIYLNSGGTIDDARHRVEAAAKRMPGMDLISCAANGQSSGVQTRQQADDGGAARDVPQGQNTPASPSSPVEDGGGHPGCVSNDQRSAVSPSSSSSAGVDQIVYAPESQGPSVSSSANPNPGGGGQALGAHKSQTTVVSPASEPSPSYLKAAGESRLQAARSILYRYTTSTGKFWGDIHPYEVGSMTRDHLRGIALMSALGPLNPRQMKMTFSQLMTPKQAQIAMEKADKELVNV
jgi:hypothetical protein